jgi:SAM-dependent methyltransferase
MSIKHDLQVTLYRLGKHVYNSLPINSLDRAKHRKLIKKYFPRLLPLESSSSGAEKSHSKADESYQQKILQELRIYEKRINVHDLPEIFHYWSQQHLAPILQEAGFSSITDFFALNLISAQQRIGNNVVSFISIGSGNCDLETTVAETLLGLGCDNFTLECLELNPTMLNRGRELAEEKGLLEHMSFLEADFNTWIPSKKYDAVMANQSLHHVLQLEHLFEQISSALHEDGSFVISDIIGRNGHQRWPEALKIVNQYWRELPKTYRFNVLLNRFEAEYENWDCSTEGFEGIRAQDILPLLLQYFECQDFVAFGNVIDIFVDRCFGHNFSPDSDWDRNFIDRIHYEDEAGFANGTLTPTHMMAVFVKKLHSSLRFSRGIEPGRAVRKS